LYDCTCGSCAHEPEQLTLGLKSKFKGLLKTVEKAFKKLHENGKYSVEDLVEVKEYRDIIRDTNGILNGVLEDNSFSSEMLKSLKSDTFYFSQLRSHAQLLEASRLLLDDQKKIKSFAQFSNDVAKVKKEYNENYLEAEYDFAVGSVQMAERWDNFKGGANFLLQYRTAKDNKVRDTHAKLDETTLPKEDAFWNKYFPPNGWRCRCTTVEVLARKYTASDSADALEKGEKATTQIDKNDKNKLEIFRFNAGKEKVVFPPTHPYRKVQDANKIKK